MPVPPSNTGLNRFPVNMVVRETVGDALATFPRRLGLKSLQHWAARKFSAKPLEEALKRGSARYLNFSGAAIFWDARDAAIKSLYQRLIGSTIPESPRAVPRQDTMLPKSGTQVTLLTRSGMYAISDPP